MSNNSVIASRKSQFMRNTRRYGAISLMALPGILYLFINNYLPMLGVIIAFKNINYADGILKSPWSGLKNFEFLFRSPSAFVITRNTILYNIVFIIFTLVLSVGLAILLNEVSGSKLVKICQSVYVIPYMVSFTIVGYIVYALLNPDYGVMNGIIKSLGKEPLNWYTETAWWPMILVLVHAWKYTGYLCIIYLAAVVGIDPEYYEAALIDGATRLQRVFHITIPLIKPVIITMTLISIGRIFYADFGLFYQTTMNSGTLYPVTDVIDTYVYRSLLTTGEIGLASAAGFYQSLVGFIIVMLSNLAVRKISREDALF